MKVLAKMIRRRRLMFFTREVQERILFWALETGPLQMLSSVMSRPIRMPRWVPEACIVRSGQGEAASSR